MFLVSKVKDHPTCKKLQVITVNGFHYVTDKDFTYNVGDKVFILEPGTEIEDSLAQELEISKYLKDSKIQVVNIGGVESRGVIIKIGDIQLGIEE